jgi:transposase
MIIGVDHNEEVFAHADRFDLYRDDLRSSVAFGRGLHFCIGQALIRIAACEALDAVLDELPRAALAEPTEPTGFDFHRLPHLHAVYGPDAGIEAGEHAVPPVPASEGSIRRALNYRGGRPRRIACDRRQRIGSVAGARPVTPGVPLTCWSLPRLAAHLAEQRIVVISPAHLGKLLAETGLSFQRTRTWKASRDADYETNAARVLELKHHWPAPATFSAAVPCAANRRRRAAGSSL